MKKVTWKAAAIGYAKERLGPELGKAYAVYVLAKILMIEAMKSPASQGIFDQVYGVIRGALDWQHVVVLGLAGLLFLGAQGVKVYSLYQPPPRLWFKFSRLGHWYSAVLGMVAGALVAPMTIWLAAVLAFFSGPWWSNHGLVPFSVALAIYLLVSFALYYAAIDDRNDAAGALIWHLKANKLVVSEASDVCAALNKHFAEILWLGKANVSSTSSDGHVVIELPLIYAMERWPATDLKAFLAAYASRDLVLKDSPFTVSAVSLSPAVKKLVEEQNANRKPKRTTRSNRR